MSDTIDPRALRDACGRFATGVTVITTTDENGDHGMTANAFMSVSLDPPLISISLDNGSRMLGKVRAAGRYAVNILAEGMENVALHFAGRPDPDLGALLEIKHGLPVVPGASVQLFADVAAEVPAGDHTLFIGRVREIDHAAGQAPLLFYSGRFQALRETA
ncbi:flavin reductase family protein [Salipiger sp. P9]|uniref:flavin reductase family protein n=1 Tax=Salipiger pentaromativorans TaxID=2943193 RepID=UPI0021573D31|nr:flavin reductase family protein [Salipiger pentaromativorans]MCR8547397.1 flavin reductase family protein [Salipiger pentaromativorans]